MPNLNQSTSFKTKSPYQLISETEIPMSYIIKIMTESIPISYNNSIKGQKGSRMILDESKFLPILGSNYESY